MWKDEIKVEKINEVQYRVEISASAETVDQKLENLLKESANDIEVKGFRKGHVPMKELKKMFRDKSKQTLSQAVVTEGFFKAIKDHDLLPVGDPIIEKEPQRKDYAGEFGFDGSFYISLILEVLPKITPTGYIGMGISLDDVQMDDVVLFEQLKSEKLNLLASHIPVNRPLQNGDNVVIDFRGTVDEVAFDGGTAENFNMENFGSGLFIPGFESGMVGMMTGETRLVNVKFPDNYGEKTLAGKDAVFEVNVKAITQVQLPEYNEEVAVYNGFETLAEMETKLKQEVQHKKHQAIKQSVENQILNSLLEKNQFMVPGGLIRQEVGRLMHANGLTDFDALNDATKQQLIGAAQNNVRRVIVLNAIYEQEKGVEISPEELDSALTYLAQQNNKKKDEFVSELVNSKQMDVVMANMKVGKVLDFIVNHSTLNNPPSPAEVVEAQAEVVG